MPQEAKGVPCPKTASLTARCTTIEFSILCLLLCFALTIRANGQKAAADPGPRSGTASAGGFFNGLNGGPGLNPTEQAFFAQVAQRFLEVQSVSGAIAGEDSGGLGPGFNGNSCKMCHAQPSIGGTSPGRKSPQNPISNPQVALASLDGASNFVPSFITVDGPVREARFVFNADGTRDGGVHDLYSITGRSDAPGCTLAQPNFAQQLANNNVIFRIPTPLFGLGLVENTPDPVLRANLASTQAARQQLGIGGSFNTSGNDGTITRFGWKAQNKSLIIFAGEAYNVEQGVTNELFPNERNAVPGCVFNPLPEDSTNLTNGNAASPNAGSPIGTASEMMSDVGNFAAFIRLLAPPATGTQGSSEQNGSTLFTKVGCSLCHSTSLTTGGSNFTGMSNVTYQPFSDFALHHMGPGLADGVVQGQAGPDEFRTAPLWGVGQRLFFLHDGRTSDLMAAILAHASVGVDCRGDHDRRASRTCGSEANAVIRNFRTLTAAQQQDLLNFLRSL